MLSRGQGEKRHVLMLAMLSFSVATPSAPVLPAIVGPSLEGRRCRRKEIYNLA